LVSSGALRHHTISATSAITLSTPKAVAKEGVAVPSFIVSLLRGSGHVNAGQSVVMLMQGAGAKNLHRDHHRRGVAGGRQRRADGHDQQRQQNASPVTIFVAVPSFIVSLLRGSGHVNAGQSVVMLMQGAGAAMSRSRRSAATPSW
jgi:hypothetical protein